MKKKLIFLSIFIFIAYSLFFPKAAVSAAANGLLLWYERLLPSLLPFAILSNILIYSNYLTSLTRYLYPVTRVILPGSRESAFVILSGFLFGFPMGSKNCAELLKCGKISKEEADILFVITNNMSPVFISSYILCQELKQPSLLLFSYLVLFLPPIFLGSLLLQKGKNTHCHSGRLFRRTSKTMEQSVMTQKTPASGSQMNFKIIDAGIMDGFETLTRLGGYIMLFSIITSMFCQLPLPAAIKVLLTGVIEITNGIHQLSALPLSDGSRYILAMAFTAFGGLSGMAQTSSMIKGTDLSMKRYLLLKLLLTFFSSLLAWIVSLLLIF